MGSTKSEIYDWRCDLESLLTYFMTFIYNYFQKSSYLSYYAYNFRIFDAT